METKIDCLINHPKLCIPLYLRCLTDTPAKTVEEISNYKRLGLSRPPTFMTQSNLTEINAVWDCRPNKEWTKYFIKNHLFGMTYANLKWDEDFSNNVGCTLAENLSKLIKNELGFFKDFTSNINGKKYILTQYDLKKINSIIVYTKLWQEYTELYKEEKNMQDVISLESIQKKLDRPSHWTSDSWYEAKKTATIIANDRLVTRGSRISSSSLTNDDMRQLAKAKTAEEKIAIYNNIRSRESSGCFITTAVCQSFNKSDDCYELTMFRDFRDKWLTFQSDGKELIQRYYQIAPSIVQKINGLPEANTIYLSIWKEYLQPCLRHLEGKNYLACKQKYVQMVEELSHRF